MKRRDSINYLKRLYVLLDRLMGSSLLGIKYTKSLKRGINSLQKNKLSVDNGTFKVNVNKKKNRITVDISHKNGELIESHTYDQDSLIGEDIIGES